MLKVQFKEISFSTVKHKVKHKVTFKLNFTSVTVALISRNAFLISIDQYRYTEIYLCYLHISFDYSSSVGSTPL